MILQEVFAMRAARSSRIQAANATPGRERPKRRLNESLDKLRLALDSGARRGPEYYNSPMFRTGRWF
jgi:hypothetical protein